MEPSFFCFEQVIQMQATQDSIVMLKMLHDYGYDVTTDPIDFYVHTDGDHIHVFENCLRKIFKDVETDNTENDESWSITYTLPMPELALYMGSLSVEERQRYNEVIQDTLHKYCDYGDAEMLGKLVGNSLQIKIEGIFAGTSYSEFLESILEIKRMIQMKTQEIINRLRCIALLKLVHEKMGIMLPNLPLDNPFLVFQSLMSELQISYKVDDLEYETIVDTLRRAIDIKLFKGAGVA